MSAMSRETILRQALEPLRGLYDHILLDCNFPLFCPWCKKEMVINVVKLKMVISDEPDA